MGRSTALSKVANAVSWEQPGLGQDDAPASLGRNLTYGLLDNLGRAIVTGQFDDEAFPTEAELTKRHGVSRTVTREAVDRKRTRLKPSHSCATRLPPSS